MFGEFENKQLYVINLDSPLSEPAILDFLNNTFKENTEARLSYFDNQINNLGHYLSMAATLRQKSKVEITDTVVVRRSNRRFVRIRVNHLKDIVDNLVARYTSQKTLYYITPQQPDDFSKEIKAKTVKNLLDTILYEQNFEEIKKRWVRDVLIYGEGYVHVSWDDQQGSLVSNTEEKVPLIGENGEPELDGQGKPVMISSQLREGDIKIELINPTMVRVQPSEKFDTAEWVLIEKLVPIERLRNRYPDEASRIRPTESLEAFDYSLFEYVMAKNLVRVYHLYHRPVEEMPHGREIIATPDVVLMNRELPVKRLWDHKLLPVIQVVDTHIYGDSRGYAGSVMEVGKGLQIALNNLYSIVLRNIAKFPPLRLWPEGSVNKEHLKSGAPMDVAYNERRGTPKIISIPPIHQEMLLLIDRLTQRLMQLTNVLPISRGETIPNTESRLMLDFFKEQELSQSLTLDGRIRDALVQLAKVVLAYALEFYDTSDKSRMLKIFGKLGTYKLERFDLESLQIPVDIHIQRGASFPDSQQGKIRQISSILSLYPNLISPQEAMDILELGQPEKLFDAETAAINLAESELEDILEGKEVDPPQPLLDLVTYYKTYLKAVQNIKIRRLIPDLADYRQLEDADLESPGSKILAQIETAESILWEKTLDNPLFKEFMMTSFPIFPTVYVPEPIVPLNPAEDLDPPIAETPSELGEL